MLSTPDAAMAVYQDEEGGILAGLSSGKGVIDCASLDAGTMRKLGELVTARGGRFLAAPVAGHSGMAVAATCQSICAGDASLFKEASPALEQLSKNVVGLGTDVGAASNTKLVINGLMANITASVGEAVAIAAKANIDENILFDLISNHAMNSQLIQLVSTDSICYSF